MLLISGSIDFVPAMLQTPSFGNRGNFEPLSVIAGRANEWMQQNASLPVCNIQSLDYKLMNTWGQFFITSFCANFESISILLVLLHLYKLRTFLDDKPLFYYFRHLYLDNYIMIIPFSMW